MSAKPVTLRPLRVGIVGLGFMGRVHLAAYAAANAAGTPCRVIGVCERAPIDARTQAVGNTQRDAQIDLARVQVTREPADLFAIDDLDLVSICTPTDTHFALALMALRAGKHVLLEKPVSLVASEIERLDLEARLAGRICMPAMCMRFAPAWCWLEEAVRSRRYGAVVSAVFTRLGGRPSWGGGFYSDSARSGGALFDLHVHDVDIVRHLFGDPDSVGATGSIDHVTAHYHYARGPAHVTAEGGWHPADGFPFRADFRVAFEQATVEFTSRAQTRLEIASKGRSESVDVDANWGYDGEIRHMLNCVREGRTSADVTLADAAAVTRILHAERHALTQETSRTRA